MSEAATGTPAWITEHRLVWSAKPALRRFYETEYFSRIVSALPKGPTLEIGAGPGFFTRFHRCDKSALSAYLDNL